MHGVAVTPEVDSLAGDAQVAGEVIPRPPISGFELLEVSEWDVGGGWREGVAVEGAVEDLADAFTGDAVVDTYGI